MKKTNLSDYDPNQVPNGKKYRIAVVSAQWNPEVTDAMHRGAVETLLAHGVERHNVIELRVPGTYELTYAALKLAQDPLKAIDAVVCIGCVIQGETRHFEFICQAVSQGFTNVALQTGKPIIFSVLTCNSMEQALARAGGQHGNKGVEGAVTALKMCNLF